MPSNLPANSTVQWGTGRGWLCMAARVTFKQRVLVFSCPRMLWNASTKADGWCRIFCGRIKARLWTGSGQLPWQR